MLLKADKIIIHHNNDYKQMVTKLLIPGIKLTSFSLFLFFLLFFLTVLLT